MAQTTLRDYLQETEDAISAGRVDEALANCQHILARFPESLEAQRLLGEVHLAQGHLEEAQHAFDWVLTNDPENVIAYCDRALISERMSDYDTALDCYQQAYELSRGNSQIRQEFNQLSTKAGQQGFMFSRAGLARLYMRGDLLTQATQEWDAVLTVTPDRLDARIGLLETYWREGSYRQVEQLATQILQDVPDCLKALLLLAFVTSTKNMPQARVHLQRVEALDPDLVMAQEIFADMMAMQPKEPFLELLKKPPLQLDFSNGAGPAVAQTPHREEAFPSANGSLSSSQLPPTGSISGWGDVNSWNGNSVFAEPQPEVNPAAFAEWARELPLDPEKPSGANPYHDLAAHVTPSGNGTASADPWSSFDQGLISPAKHEETQPEPWELLQEAQHTFTAQASNASDLELSPWESLDSFGNADSEGASVWGEGIKDPSLGEPSDPWAMPSLGGQASDSSAPPAWLSMLTQNERQQLSGKMPIVPPVEKKPAANPPVQPISSSGASWEIEPPRPIASQPTVSSSGASWGAEPSHPVTEQPAASLPSSGASWKLDAQPAQPSATLPSSADEEMSFFGPEWLKSIGATLLDEEAAPQSALVETAQSVPNEPLKGPFAEPQVRETYASWGGPPSDPQEKVEQNLLATLEELEHGLLSQGFAQLEPNSLASIARSQETAPAASANTDFFQEEYQSQAAYRDPTLSSALAELGNFFQEGPSATNPVATPTPSASFEPIRAASLESNASFISASAAQWEPEIAEAPIEKEALSHAAFSLDSMPWQSNDIPASPMFNAEPASWQSNGMSSMDVPAYMEAGSGPVFEPRPASISQPIMSTPPVTPPDPLLDSELETTMKRPAVRLQPMQSKPAMSRGDHPLSSSSGRGRASERAARAADSKLSYQERLLKGYQYQLAGDYDDAMQEYRIIIRSAPELLSEVVSNVRALLKLAPNYSAGYRVLGDAYMRQGEYLQAMEAYNKALTMAKKARG